MQSSALFPNASSSYLGPQGEPPLSRTGYIILSVIMAIFTGPAIVLNSTVIIVTLMHKQLRQPLNYALVNMAVADLGTAVIGGVLSVVNNAQGYFSLGRTGCVMEGWNLPPLFGWGRYELEGVGTSCAPDWHSRDPGNVSYVLAYFAVCFAVPFVVILTSYTRLLWTLHRVSKMDCLEDGAVAKVELKVACMVVLMVLTFLLSWLPYAALAMLVVYDPDVYINPLIGTVPVYLAKSSTVYNPLIYIYCNKQFRKYAVPFLLCGKELWEDEVSEGTTVMTANNRVSPA